MAPETENVVDLTLEAKDLTPKKAMSKGLALLEVGLGGLSHGMVKSLTAGKIPIDPMLQESLVTLGSMGASGLVDSNDAKNYFGGITAASASKLAEQLIDRIKQLWNMKMPKAVGNSSTANSGSSSYADSLGYNDPF